MTSVKAPLILSFPVVLLTIAIGVSSCADKEKTPITVTPPKKVYSGPAATANWIKKCPKISLLRRQVSGRYDGASSWDNIVAMSNGGSAKRSWYGNAPGGYTKLDSRMLNAMKTLANEGYTFNVTSIAGGSHSRTSRHYAGIAFDVSIINGQQVRAGNPYWRKFLSRCRQLGATETLGPGDKAHSTHIHAAWPR